MYLSIKPGQGHRWNEKTKGGGGAKGVAEKYEWGDFFVRKLQILAFTPFLSIIRIKISLTWGKKCCFSQKLNGAL